MINFVISTLLTDYLSISLKIKNIPNRKERLRGGLSQAKEGTKKTRYVVVTNIIVTFTPTRSYRSYLIPLKRKIFPRLQKHFFFFFDKRQKILYEETKWPKEEQPKGKRKL